MTPVYKVKTKHTKEMLKTFIEFSTRVNHGSTTFRLCLLGVCFLLIALAFKGNVLPMAVWGTIGVLVLVFAFTRKYISLSKLKKNDPNYKNSTDILFTFGQSEFIVENVEAGDDVHIKYGEIDSFYVDDDYYYINVNNKELQMIPRADFIMGNAGRFQDFIERKTGKLSIPAKLSLIERIKILRAEQKLANEKHDREWEERRLAQKKAKEEKKKR